MDQVYGELAGVPGPFSPTDYANTNLGQTTIRQLAAAGNPASPFLSPTNPISFNDLRGKKAMLNATGGNATYDVGGFRIHVFTGPGTLTVNWALGSSDSAVEYVVVAGGGAGAGQPGGTNGGAGGAGGFRTGTISLSDSPVTVAVGGGGAAQPASTPGTVSTITYSGGPPPFAPIVLTAARGGAGNTGPGDPGGSGGGGGINSTPPGLTSGGTGNTPPVSPPQGNTGGGNTFTPGPACTGGGGGATAVGERGNTTLNRGGAGGNGAFVPWVPGIPVSYGSPRGYFAGGGGGCPDNSNIVPVAPGGLGGGGSGCSNPSSGSVAAQAGVINTGGGGGACGFNLLPVAQPGGSGIVFLRYAYP